MTWKKERDVLIAQTMAFVQSVAGKTADADRRPNTRLPSISPVQPSIMERPADILPAAHLLPINRGDLRDEIGRRVAAFRARQQLFNRDRDEYCDAMMEKVRAATVRTTTGHDTQPPKR